VLGVIALILLPIGVIPVLGYSIAATRAASDPAAPLPPWRLSAQMLGDGLAVAIAIALIAAPFVLVGIPLSGLLANGALWHSNGVLLSVEATTSAGFILALPWGIVMLLLMPHAVARFARDGRIRDLFDFAASLRAVRHDFPTWNVVIAAIVTAWAIGVACTALFCVGLAPGAFYAILVSAHATASLHPEGARSSAW